MWGTDFHKQVSCKYTYTCKDTHYTHVYILLMKLKQNLHEIKFLVQKKKNVFSNFMYISRGIINFIYKINLLMFLFMLKLMKSMWIRCFMGGGDENVSLFV